MAQQDKTNEPSLVRTIGINFYKAARLEPPLFKLLGFPAFEPHISDVQGLLNDITDDLMPT